MTEREMEDLLWTHSEKFFNEPLTQFQRQPRCEVGRADLVFKDRLGRLLVVELKRGKLERGAIDQLLDYHGMMKRQCPDTPVELMVVANAIPEERRLACDRFDINCLVISEKKYRDVATEVGYQIASEAADLLVDPPTLQPSGIGPETKRQGQPSKTEKSWACGADPSGKKYVMAFVNAKGSCSLRTFDADGYFLSREYGSGDYQDSFEARYKQSIPLRLSHQPNLEQQCRTRLPGWVMDELLPQIVGSR